MSELFQAVFLRVRLFKDILAACLIHQIEARLVDGDRAALGLSAGKRRIAPARSARRLHEVPAVRAEAITAGPDPELVGCAARPGAGRGQAHDEGRGGESDDGAELRHWRGYPFPRV